MSVTPRVCWCHGRGSLEHCGVLSRVSVVTSTIGKALGGSSGGMCFFCPMLILLCVLVVCLALPVFLCCVSSVVDVLL